VGGCVGNLDGSSSSAPAERYVKASVANIASWGDAGGARERVNGGTKIMQVTFPELRMKDMPAAW
jgi:hypothetical protein